MVDGLAENDPYREMKTAEKDIRPEFLQGTDKQKEREEKSGRAAAGLGAAEKVASGALGKGGGGAVGAIGGVAGGVAGGVTGGLFSGVGKLAAASEKGKGKGKFGIKASAGVVLILGLMLAAVAIGTIGSPMFLIGALDFNLQRTLGFSGTVGILEKQAEYITGEMLSKGEVPDGYAGDLAAAGITVGQVTAAGDFVRTNTYAAEIDELSELAVAGSGFQMVGGEGELAVLFDGKVTAAEDFAAAVEADPKMYAAYSEAANISARFYYSDSVDKVYQDMGVKRDAFGGWKATGDDEKDKENFEKILSEVLDNESAAEMAGCDEESCNEKVGSTGDADEILDGAKRTANGTGNAAQLLNSALSSAEPYKATSAFMAVEEPIQRARIQGDGPVNELMTVLTEEKEVEYTDATTGEAVNKKTSILETPNFAAAVSDEKFSRSEAASFSRDRILTVTGTDDKALVKGTSVAAETGRKSNVATTAGGGGVDDGVLSKAKSGISIGLSGKGSEQFTSVIGGNRIVEGGSFLSNKINMKVLGAMPSDTETVSRYNREVKEVLARKAEAERATLSPFDISSPNTFLGSIVHGVAMNVVRNRANSGGSDVTAVTGAVADLTGDSVRGLLGEAMADGEDENFLSTSGDNCKTVNSAAKAEADLYCTQKTTMFTGLMKKDKEYWDKEIDKEKYKNDFVLTGMARESTVGTKDVEVCKKYKEVHNNPLDDLLDFLGVYKECDGVDGGVATGSGFVMSDDNKDVKKYSGYTLYDTVSSLLGGTESTAMAIMNEYEATHPLDNSAAGKLARISGLSREEAQIALDYSAYLTEIARYDATDRYVFGGLKVERKDLLVEHANELAVDLYCLWSGRVRYADVRNRTFVM